MAFIQLTLYSNDKEILVNTENITTIIDSDANRTVYFIDTDDHIKVKESLEVIKEMVGN